MIRIRWSLLAALALSVFLGAAVTAQDTPRPTKKSASKQTKKAAAKQTRKAAKKPVTKPAVPETFALDKPVQNFTFKDLFHEPKEDEKPGADAISLASFQGKKNVILYFMSEHCDVTRLYDARMGALLKEYAGKDLAVLGVRCSANDTPEGLRKWVNAKNFNIPLLNDEKGALSSYFKIVRTPSFALIDTKGVLRYFGSFDDAPEESDVKKTYLPDALKAVMEEKVVRNKLTQPFG